MSDKNESFHVKYRPKTFDEVVGHKDTLKSLRKAVESRRVHTFLFTGPAGTGKTSLARIIANELCHGEAGAANIEEIPAAIATGVDAMRQVADRAQYRAIGKHPYKIVILDEAHRLSSAAWDALLKATEEPPKHVFYIFCTTNPGKIPKTILTRCTQYDLSQLSEDDILKILKRVIKKEKLDVESEVVEAVAESSGGSARQALVFLEMCLFCETAAEARKVMKQAGETKEAVDLARFLLNKQGRNWKDAQRLLVALKDYEAESIRIMLCNYFAAVILGSKSEKEAVRVMGILDCFSQTYYPATKHAELILSIGEALDM